MTLIKSISGIRGTIGGKINNNLTPIDIVKYAAAYGQLIVSQNILSKKKSKLVIGRDARISGEIVASLVCSTLQSLGIDIIYLDLSTTPTVEIAVVGENAQGGIIITASHNPEQWNALKLLNHKGEFISGDEGERITEIAEQDNFQFAQIYNLGTIMKSDVWMEKHIQQILALPLIDAEAIQKANFKIAVDAVNSTGGVFVPNLLKALGITVIEKLYCEPTGHFPHNPEPLPENITEISTFVKNNHFDLGIIVDPDVDRLAFVCENGKAFGEEYTLVAVADFILSHTKGNTVSNLSSTRALQDITQMHGMEYNSSAVGEVNVVEKMKETNAIIGGEGNGGIIYPAIHYGRDALVGIALFLTHLAKKEMTVSQLKASYPQYYISKNKIVLTQEINVDEILETIQKKYSSNPINTIDGVKINFENEWVHLRKSNTEPIIRIYAESKDENSANALCEKIIAQIHEIVKK